MHELTEEALVAASLDTVWVDFTDAACLAEWYWPPRFETEALVELEPQGRWEVRSAVADLAVEATVLAIDAPRALRLQWRWAGEEHATDVEIALEPAADDATRVIVRHAGFVSAEERENHVEGWSSCLQRLIARHGLPPRG
ncbi:SRPBCC domain-containing protein [Microbacterium deminutum]|uniref:Activator of Hsp90 ATPase homologue 1/2-like C-terminal domain-containing protein n=1 Tax=Microbacterium deminutum TaxID=344164 RepID=A0ABP5BQ52_9MICO